MAEVLKPECRRRLARLEWELRDVLDRLALGLVKAEEVRRARERIGRERARILEECRRIPKEVVGDA